MRRVALLFPSLQGAIGLLLVFSAAITAGCKSKTEGVTEAKKATAQGASSAALTPLTAPRASVLLELTGLPKTVLELPLGITKRASLVVVLGDTQENVAARCRDFHEATERREFTLCQGEIEGDFIGTGRTMAGASALRAALREVTQRFPGYVKPSQVTLVGLTNMAPVVVELTRESPEFFYRIGLIEGGFAQWTAVDSARFSRIASSRVWLQCSQKGCEGEASRVTATLRASGVPTRLDLLLAEPATGDAGASLRRADHRSAMRWLRQDTGDGSKQP